MKAPRNWVQKKGAKRRCVSSENWLAWLMVVVFRVEGIDNIQHNRRTNNAAAHGIGSRYRRVHPVAVLPPGR
ncbi:hypothetical protein GCM10011572_03550 [Pseudoduganella buxea]|uniref:Uncharacterized protein n=1 Tax=Pseudoduganella buxea TaxID=1949069 RepID=A0ABQ1K1P7_9BURK|nr:hypothetical protein GCM10011572_03550 [Pseudoduganella buxea]